MSTDKILVVLFAIAFIGNVVWISNFIWSIRSRKQSDRKVKERFNKGASAIPKINGLYDSNIVRNTFDQSGETVKAVFIDDHSLTGFIVKKSDVTDCFGLGWIAQAAVRKEGIQLQPNGLIRKPEFLAKHNGTDKVIAEITEKMNDVMKLYFMEYGHLVEISVPTHATKNIVLGHYVYALLVQQQVKPIMKGSLLGEIEMAELRHPKFFDE